VISSFHVSIACSSTSERETSPILGNQIVNLPK
jgi:hypothetical protein